METERKLDLTIGNLIIVYHSFGSTVLKVLSTGRKNTKFSYISGSDAYVVVDGVIEISTRLLKHIGRNYK